MKIFRADLLTMRDGDLLFIEDAAMLVSEDGKISEIMEFNKLSDEFLNEVSDLRPCLIMPGFIDTHVHYPQTNMRGSWSGSLLEWLMDVAYKEEGKFSNETYSKSIACSFLDNLLSNGTTTALSYGSSFKRADEILLETAYEKGYPLIAGMVFMDREVDENLRIKAQKAYDEHRAISRKWRKKGRIDIALTPRFAISCSEEMLNVCKAIATDDNDIIIQTHLSESKEEIKKVRELFPESRYYLDVYLKYDLVKEKSIFAHCIHLSDYEWEILREKGSSISHCPSSNLFLGSGLFNFRKARDLKIKTGIGTDVGAGTSFSMLHNAELAYYIQKIQGYNMMPVDLFASITSGAAEVLGLQDQIGTLEKGKYADFVVIAPENDSNFQDRYKTVENINEKLFLIIMSGQERLISRVYISGNLTYKKE